jgi:hypothetical protein
MIADINMASITGDQFSVIGSSWSRPFTGTFDGNEHVISNFSCTGNGTAGTGVFGNVQGASGGLPTLRNIGLHEPNVGSEDRNWVGSLVGWMHGDIGRCFVNGGSVTGNVGVGGLVGYQYIGNINECYATCSISGDEMVGGLVGGSSQGSFSHCYSAGFVSGTGGDVGGLLGEGLEEMGYDCFWDVNTSGQSTSAAGTPKTTTQMQIRSTFTDAGWDMVNVWDIGEGQTYPFLRIHLPSDINKDDETNFLDLAILAEHWLDEM